MERYFNEKALDKKSVGDKSPVGLLQSPAIKAGSLKKKPFSNTVEAKAKFLSSNSNEVCSRLKLLLHEK